MAHYSMVFDVSRCNGCYACFLACKDEFTGNSHLPTAEATCALENLIRVNETEYGTGSKVKVDYVPVPCQQCENPACMQRFPETVYKRADGIVIIDPEKARGKKELVSACPYGAIVWNEQLALPQKCTMCAHMLDAGEKVTRCSECCPNGALIFGDVDDPESEISRFLAEKGGKAEKFMPKFGTQPVLSYIDLPSPFICGEAVCGEAVCGETDACLEGAKVTCKCLECGTVFETETDFLGDFELRGLPQNKPFAVTVELEGYESLSVNTRTMAAVNLGELRLRKYSDRGKEMV